MNPAHDALLSQVLEAYGHTDTAAWLASSQWQGANNPLPELSLLSGLLTALTKSQATNPDRGMPFQRANAAMEVARDAIAGGDSNGASFALSLLDAFPRLPPAAAILRKRIDAMGDAAPGAARDMSQAMRALGWNRAPESISDTLQSLDPERLQLHLGPVDEKLISSIYDMRGDAGMSKAEFRQRALYGRAAGIFLRTMVVLLRRARRDPDQAAEADRIFRQLDAIAGHVDDRAIRDRLAAGLGTMAVSLHTSFLRFLRWRVEQIDVPRLVVASNAREASNWGRHAVFQTRGDLGTGLLRAAKLVRSEPRFVVIAPDGKFGESSASIEIGGRKVHMSMGAAYLAYKGRADTVFHYSRMVAGRVEFTQTPGPVWQDGMLREDWDAEWVPFLRMMVESVVFGQPECMGLSGGMWDDFAT
ncbi:MAG: hypothetical protein Q7J57_03130 [Gemmobacter sp.]|nr:hypothetical protein [Gemmobacter sp.]